MWMTGTIRVLEVKTSIQDQCAVPTLSECRSGKEQRKNADELSVKNNARGTM